MTFTNVGLVLTVCLGVKQIINFRNDTEKQMFELLGFFRIPLCLLHLSTCLTGWVYDQESTNQLITEPYGNFRSILAEQG